MRTLSVAITLAIFFVMGLSVIAADEKQDAARLETLVSNIDKVLPDGWTVEFVLRNADNPSQPGSCPTLVVRSDRALPLQHFYPGMGPDDESEISSEILSLYFVATPYQSLQDYREARKENEVSIARRSVFAREHLKGISWAHKGPRPIPPDAFNPQTEQETALIKQYAFLWLRTELQRLPTHWIETLSFEVRWPGPIKIHDEKRETQYARILDDVQEIIVPYEKVRP